MPALPDASLLYVLACTFLAAAAAIPLMGLLRPRRPSSLAGQHVLITGGSKGIGLALAHEFVARGCHVTVVARDLLGLTAALQELRGAADRKGLTVQLQALQGDVGDSGQVRRAGLRSGV